MRRFVWFDEIFTLDIARASSLSQLWRMSLKFDSNPTPVYLLSRLSMAIFGVNPLGLRLPSILEFFAGSLAMFFYMRRKVGTRYAAVAVLTLWASGTFFYAIEARPYALMFMCFSFLLLSWDGAVTDRTRTRVALGRRDLEFRLVQRSCFCAALAFPVSCCRMRALPPRTETRLSVVGCPASARCGDGDLSSTYQQLSKNTDISSRNTGVLSKSRCVLLLCRRHSRAPLILDCVRRGSGGFLIAEYADEAVLFAGSCGEDPVHAADTQSSFLESGIDAAARVVFRQVLHCVRSGNLYGRHLSARLSMEARPLDRAACFSRDASRDCST